MVMEAIIKLTILTVVVLEVMAVITHFDLIIATIGSSISALMPSIIILLAIIYLIISLFR